MGQGRFLSIALVHCLDLDFISLMTNKYRHSGRITVVFHFCSIAFKSVTFLILSQRDQSLPLLSLLWFVTVSRSVIFFMTLFLLASLFVLL